MEEMASQIMTAIETSGRLAPLLFILIHVIRPIFFLPVAFITVFGGVLFGTIYGSIYSMIGVTLSSLSFYIMIKLMPKMLNKFTRLKEKVMGKYPSLSMKQIALLRLIPFIHFHLLSLCVIELSSNFKEYTRASFLSNIPLAVVYTSFGQWISNLSPAMAIVAVALLLPMIYLLRSKEVIVKWEDFFHSNKEESFPQRQQAS
ncbi:VTT domain-containing protein [Bacillaceae bacterium S4-13-58]